MNMCSYICCDTPTSASEDIQDLSGLLKIVGEQNCLQLLGILRYGGEHCVCEFEDHVKGLSQSLISHHLADLKQAGLVTTETRGPKMHYSLTTQGIYVTNVIFSLLTNKEETMQQTQKSSGGCCSSNAATVTDEASDKIADTPCCESGTCKDTNCNRKDNQNEDRSCGNGMRNVSATTRDNQASCC